MKKLRPPSRTTTNKRARAGVVGNKRTNSSSPWSVSFYKIQVVFIIAIGASMYIPLFYVHQYGLLPSGNGSGSGSTTTIMENPQQSAFDNDGKGGSLRSSNPIVSPTTTTTTQQQQQKAIMMLTRESFQGGGNKRIPSRSDLVSLRKQQQGSSITTTTNETPLQKEEEEEEKSNDAFLRLESPPTPPQQQQHHEETAADKAIKFFAQRQAERDALRRQQQQHIQDPHRRAAGGGREPAVLPTILTSDSSNMSRQGYAKNLQQAKVDQQNIELAPKKKKERYFFSSQQGGVVDLNGWDRDQHVPPGDNSIIVGEGNERVFQLDDTNNHNNNNVAHTIPASSNRPQTERRRRPKVLLAITSSSIESKNAKWDFRRRHIARNTWMNFDPKWYGIKEDDTAADVANIPTNQTCSLQEYQNYTSATDREACHFVYTFLASARLKANWSEVENEGRQVKGRHDDDDGPLTIPPSSFNGTYETDVLYLNVHQNDRIGMGWAWSNYLLNLFDDPEETRPGLSEDDFDYIGYTDSDTLLLPTEFWGNKIFGIAPKDRLYAGYAMHPVQQLCSQKEQKCLEFKPHDKATLTATKSVMHRFVLLSTDLLRLVAESNPYQINPELTPNDTFDIGIANVLYNQLRGQLRLLKLHGIVPRIIKTGSRNPNGGVGDPLERFDKYKDEFVNYDEPEEVALVKASGVPVGIGENPRLLLGIFSMLDNQEETEKREMIRKSYLSSMGNHLICSLQDLAGRLDKPDECQLAYTFVVGGNPNGPKELVEYNSSFPLTIENTMSPSEPDMLVLNIKENMKEGKSQTFFKYATTVVDTSVYFDYIAKADSDTVVIPNLLLNDEINKLPRFPNNTRTFAGSYRVKIPEKPEPHVGPNYFGGFFYFMSPDLARYISSPQCNRSALAVWSEDQSMGSFVHSHPRPIRRHRILTNWHRHPVKEVRDFGMYWNYLVRVTNTTGGGGQRVAVPRPRHPQQQQQQTPPQDLVLEEGADGEVEEQ